MKSRHIMQLLWRFVVCCLCATLVVGMLAMTAFSHKTALAPEAKVGEVNYLIQFVAGETGYTGVGHLEITYIDNENNTKTETVAFGEPQSQMLPDGTWKDVAGAELIRTVHQRGMAAPRNTASEINGIARQFTGAHFQESTDSWTVPPYGTYTINLPVPARTIKSVEKVVLKLEGNKGMSLQSLRVVEYDSSRGGLGSYFNGTLSGQLEWGWAGHVLAEASGMCYGNYTPNEFSKAKNNLKQYTISYDKYGFANGQLLDNRALTTQGISFHIADTPDAGIETLLADVRTESWADIPFVDRWFDAGAFKQLGVDAYNAYQNLNPIFSECLNLEVTYEDVRGSTRKVEIPAITLYLVQILCDNEGWLCGQGLDSVKTWISGIFQQNETIALTLRLAQYKSLKGIQLTYGETPDNIVNSIYDPFARTVDTKNDTFAIDNVCFYEEGGAEIRNVYDSQYLTCLPTLPAKATYHFAYPYSGGWELKHGQPLSMTLENGLLEKGSLKQTSLQNLYVFGVDTSEVNGAGTYNGIYMDITYMDTNGVEQRLEGLSLKELAFQFCGYTCNVDSKYAKAKSVYWANVDKYSDVYMSEVYQTLQYWASMSQPGTIAQFALEIPDVEHFISISFTLRYDNTYMEDTESEEGSRIDAWQCRGVVIYKATSLGQRYSYDGRSQHLAYVNENSVFPRWERRVEGEEVAWIWQTMLLQASVPSQTYQLHYNDKDGNLVIPDDSGEEIEKDYVYKRPTFMSYAEAAKRRGQAYPKFIYEVSVEVADVFDAGSANYFYFQLIFEKGTSAVVLANQQLSADSFRQGYTEVFQIRVPYNYGELKSIRIICDTHIPDDKLNISSISVRRQGSTGISKAWKIDNVGWIAVPDMTKDFYTGNGNNLVPSQTVNRQIVQEYPVTGSATAVDLLFCITTSASSKYSAKNYNASQHAFYATLVYLDSSGARKVRTFDLVEIYQTFNGTNNTSVMFRSNHVDRFLLSLEDVSSILSLEIERQDGDDWIVENITVQQVGGVGNPYLSYADEYIRNAKSATELTSAQGDPVTISAHHSASFLFKENKIEVNESENSDWDATVSRVPDTTNDALNIYIHAGTLQGKANPFTFGTQINGSLKYSTIYGSSKQTAITFQPGEWGSEIILYVEDFPVNDLATLQTLTLINGSDQETVVVDYAVVERVRSNVIVNTYRYNYGKELDSRREAGPDGKVETARKQTVTLRCAAGQASVSLTPESSDVAVALCYTSLNSPQGQNRTYQSPYIFLTDQQIMALSANQTVELTFDVCNVDQIVGLTVVSTGPTVEFKSATANNYDSQNNRLLGSYQAAKAFGVSKNGKTTVVMIRSGTYAASAASIGEVKMGTDSALLMPYPVRFYALPHTAQDDERLLPV